MAEKHNILRFCVKLLKKTEKSDLRTHIGNKREIVVHIGEVNGMCATSFALMSVCKYVYGQTQGRNIFTTT